MILLNKRLNERFAGMEKLFYLFRRTIGAPYPNNMRWKAEYGNKNVEVAVFCVIPNYQVVRSVELNIRAMKRIREIFS